MPRRRARVILSGRFTSGRHCSPAQDCVESRGGDVRQQRYLSRADAENRAFNGPSWVSGARQLSFEVRQALGEGVELRFGLIARRLDVVSRAEHRTLCNPVHCLVLAFRQCT